MVVPIAAPIAVPPPAVVAAAPADVASFATRNIPVTQVQPAVQVLDSANNTNRSGAIANPATRDVTAKKLEPPLSASAPFITQLIAQSAAFGFDIRTEAVALSELSTGQQLSREDSISTIPDENSINAVEESQPTSTEQQTQNITIDPTQDQIARLRATEAYRAVPAAAFLQDLDLINTPGEADDAIEEVAEIAATNNTFQQHTAQTNEAIELLGEANEITETQNTAGAQNLPAFSSPTSILV